MTTPAPRDRVDQTFKVDVIARLEADRWQMTAGDILDFAAKQKEDTNG